MTRTRPSRRALTVVFLTIFIDLLGVGILIPVVPLLLADPASPQYILSPGFPLARGYILLGYLVAMFPLFQFIAAPILGQLSDKFGRRPVIAISIAGTSLSYILFAVGILIRNIPLLFFSRAFDGITAGSIAAAQACIADVTRPEDRAKTFGLIGAAFGLGFILGPAIGGILADPSVLPWFGASTPFWFAAILSAANAASVLLFLPETARQRRRMLKIRWTKSLSNILHAYTFTGLRTMFSTVFLFNAGFTFFTTFSSVFFIARFGFSQRDIGNFFAYVGIWIAITQALVTRAVAKRFRDISVLRIALFGSAVAVACYLLPTHWWQLLFIVPFFSIFAGLSQVFSTNTVSRLAGPEIQGEVLGINASIQALAQSLPPILSGYIAARLSPASPVLVASAVLLCAAIIFLVFFRMPRVVLHEEATT